MPIISPRVLALFKYTLFVFNSKDLQFSVKENYKTYGNDKKPAGDMRSVPECIYGYITAGIYADGKRKHV